MTRSSDEIRTMEMLLNANYVKSGDYFLQYSGGKVAGRIDWSGNNLGWEQAVQRLADVYQGAKTDG